MKTRFVDLIWVWLTVNEAISSKDVKLNLKTQPIIFGKNTLLSCQSYNRDNGSCIIPSTRLWYGGKHFDLIVLDGVSVNSHKYAEVIEGECSISTLIIKDFREDDANCEYGCTLGFDNAEINLHLTNDTFLYLPTAEEIDASFTDDNEFIRIVIVIAKVYPVPVCSVNRSSQIIQLDVATYKNGLLYKANVDQTIDVLTENGGEIILSCVIQSHEILSKKHIVKGQNNAGNYFFVPVLIVGVVVMLATLTYILRRQKKTWKEQLKKKRTPCSLSKPNTYTTEESSSLFGISKTRIGLDTEIEQNAMLSLNLDEGKVNDDFSGNSYQYTSQESEPFTGSIIRDPIAYQDKQQHNIQLTVDDSDLKHDKLNRPTRYFTV